MKQYLLRDPGECKVNSYYNITFMFIYEYGNIQQIHYCDSVHNREYHYFTYCDSKIFSIT